ncbi:calcium/sodium antiporter [Candidatus Parcubacteria bacterium]|nr:calcium/sodium antiporter [Candidatus Parcubacteria bacterium]
MVLSILAIAAGLIILIGGAEGLVRGASSLAAKLKVSPLVIGLTVVAFGTSAPELTVNVLSALNNSPDLAIGNIVGSNTANVLLILGITALIRTLKVKSSTVWKEIPLALLGVTLLFVMGNDALFDGVGFNALTRTDGIALMALMAIFLYYIFGMAKSERSHSDAKNQDDEQIKIYPYLASTGLTVGGLIALVIGGRLLVNGAIDIAAAAGLSEALIGLTIVAIGTSLPELATSIVAALKGRSDIAVGNIIGSIIFNVFWVLGLTSVITPLPFTSDINFDVLVSVGSMALLFIFMHMAGKRRLIRWEGAVFVVLYIAYLTFLVYRG